MAVITKAVVFMTLVLSATALTTPHHARNVVNHHDLAARIVAPAAPVEPVAPAPVVRRSEGASAFSRRKKRSSNGRCKARSNSATAASSTAAPSSSAAAPSPTSSSAAFTSSSAVDFAPPSSAAAPSTSDAPSPTPTPTTSSTSSTLKPTTSSTSQAPPATTEQPTSTTQEPTSTSSAADSSGTTPSFLDGTQTGQGTFYATGLGSCGITNSDSDYIAAVSHLLYDVFPGYDGSNPNSNPVCNKKVTATYQGKSVTVKITDRCTGCALTDLDFSPSAFQQLSDESVGRISGMTWVWDD